MTTRPTLGRIWATNGVRVDPGSLKYSNGWIGEIPTYEVLNFMQYRIDAALQAFAERGVPEWGPDVIYVKGAKAWGSDGKIYVATVDSPSRTKQPSTNPSQWELSSDQFTMAQHQAMINEFDAHIVRRDDPHDVTAEQAGTYTSVVIDGKIDPLKLSLNSHIADKNNPHGETAESIGAVPKSGGAYTGPVSFAGYPVKINPGAGSHEIFGDAANFGIRTATATLAIEKATNRAFIMVGGVKNYLLSETEYTNYRRTIEPQYAVGTPDLEIDMMSDTHLRQGFGFSNFLRPTAGSYTDKGGVARTAQVDEPRHTLKGLVIDESVQERLDVDAENNASGFPSITYNVRGMMGARYAVDTHLLTAVSSRADILYIQADGRVGFNLKNSSGVSAGMVSILQVPLDVEFSITVVVTPTGCEMYLDGVLQATLTGSYNADTYSVLRVGSATNRTCAWYARSLKVWAKELTATQVTTL